MSDKYISSKHDMSECIGGKSTSGVRDGWRKDGMEMVRFLYFERYVILPTNGDKEPVSLRTCHCSDWY
jgi:hypothetical protein